MKTHNIVITIVISILFFTSAGQNINHFRELQLKSQGAIKTIHDIQYTADPNGVSPYSGDTATVVGIVTSSAQNYDLGYIYIQDEGGGPWSGILIFGPGLADLYRGEEIIVFGEVREDFFMTSLAVSSVTLTGRYKDVVISDIDLSDSLSYIGNGWEKWESVLIRYKDPYGAQLKINKTNVHAPSSNYGDYSVSVIGKKAVNKLGIILAGRQTSAYYSSLWVQIVNHSHWFDNSGQMNVPPILADTAMRMDAVVGQMLYGYGDYQLTPRNNDDFININVELEKTNLPVSPLTSIQPIEINDISIYPNPTSDLVNIISESESINFYELYDIQGRQLLHRQTNSNMVKIDVSFLQEGIYVLVLNTGKYKVTSTKINVKR
jgi:hypothetical protein